MDLKLSPLWTTLAALAVAVALFAAGYRAGMAKAVATPRVAPAAASFPDWFLPIWDAYDRNPAITPDFDFAALYSGEVPVDRR